MGTPTELADLMQAWQRVGIEGFRLRPGALPHDLESITHELVSILQDRSAFRLHYEEATLRPPPRLQRPANRYATA